MTLTFNTDKHYEIERQKLDYPRMKYLDNILKSFWQDSVSDTL